MEAALGFNLEAYHFFFALIDQGEKFTINIHEALKGISIHFWPPAGGCNVYWNTYTI